MTEPIHPEVAILNAALELPPKERAAYLDHACAGDAALRRQVEALIAAHEQASNFLEAPPAVLDLQQAAKVNPPPAEKPGDRIGRYKLLEQLGEGGFGVVYMAEQIEPVQRKVALKVIKPGMDTKEVIARFEAERQALALMDHPNIARVLDGGTTEAGRPFFVMELVKGVPLTEFCDAEKLSPAERLGLFIKVCQAVQHAHQKGIIHRDLKPSNVLVTLHDGVPVPKVIDFGVAKALGQKLTEKTLFTSFARLIGTPVYMSPEQAELSGLDIDTRSDIYSLGVLLYELLTGVTPFDKETFAKAALDEVRRMIRETEPPKPSTRLKTLGQKLTDVANRRHTEPPKLIHLVRGDLDWIVMKCLEKDRTRRYATANGLAMDLQRHLNHEAVSAAAPTAYYRARKFIARNRTALGVVVAMVLLLLAGTIVSTWQAVRATRAERATRREAIKSGQVANFLKDMLEGVGPSKARGRDTQMLQEILDKTAERVGNDLHDQPEVEAEMLNIMGEVYRALGDYEKAEAMHESALSIWQRLRGNMDVDVAKTLSNLGLVYESQSRMEEAEGVHRRAVAILTALLPPDDEAVLSARNNLAMALGDREEFEEAEAEFRHILTIRTNTLGDHKRTADTFNNLAWLRWRRNDAHEAESLHRQALAMRQRLFKAPHPDIAASLSGLGLALQAQGRFAEAETSQVAAVEMFRKLLPPKHPDLATALNNLALVFGARGKWKEAEDLNREILAIRQEVLPTPHAYTAATLNNLAWVLQKQGKLEEAEDYYRQALKMRKTISVENTDVVASLTGLALLLRDRGKLEEAETNALEALGMFRKLKLNNPYYEAILVNNLALILGDEKQLARAEELHREALRIGSNAPPNDVAIWLNNLANVREKRGDLNQALDLHRQALALRTKVFGPDHPDVAASLESIARVLLKQGKPVEARSRAQKCLDIWEQRDADDWRTCNARSLLGGSFLGQKRYAEAEPLLLSGYEGLKEREDKIPRGSRPRLQEAAGRLVQLYEEWDKPAELEKWRAKLQ